MGIKAMIVNMQWYDDRNDVQASNNPSGDDYWCASGGEFSTSSGVSECWISDLSARDEII
jgi:hypothetical protein